jgi:hypothetical protein
LTSRTMCIFICFDFFWLIFLETVANTIDPIHTIVANKNDRQPARADCPSRILCLPNGGRWWGSSRGAPPWKLVAHGIPRRYLQLRVRLPPTSKGALRV